MKNPTSASLISLLTLLLCASICHGSSNRTCNIANQTNFLRVQEFITKNELDIRCIQKTTIDAFKRGDVSPQDYDKLYNYLNRFTTGFISPKEFKQLMSGFYPIVRKILVNGTPQQQLLWEDFDEIFACQFLSHCPNEFNNYDYSLYYAYILFDALLGICLGE